jgi:pimeloyl-ACP methyl ester carboxylesterase
VAAALVAPRTGNLERFITWFNRQQLDKMRQQDGFVRRDMPVTDADGTAAHVRLLEASGQGSAPPIVVFHGITGEVSTYRPLLKALQKIHSRVIAVELPGHGGSTPLGTHVGPPPAKPYEAYDRCMERVRQALDPVLALYENVILLGHSFGGAVAVGYREMCARPEAVEKMVLVSPDGGYFSPERLAHHRQTHRVNDPHCDVRGLAAGVWPNQPAKVWLMSPFLKASMGTPLAAYAIESDLLQPFVSAERLERLPPTCLIWGTAEALASPEDFEHFRTHLPPGSVIEEPVGLGHAAVIDAPPAIMNAIARFCAPS